MTHPLYMKDIKAVADHFDGWRTLHGSKILVTGATGMVCSCVVDILMYLNESFGANITVYATGRSTERLRKRFGSYAGNERLHFIELDTTMPAWIDVDVDHIIHGASNADPASMTKYPVETFKSNIIGMDTLLALAKQKGAKRTLFVSSGEMYGMADASVADGYTEDFCGAVDYTNPRSCYPSGKRAAEMLCQCYASEYGLDVVIARLCHIYGPTMLATDPRAISAFIRNAAEGQDIIMKSKGELVRSHCYVTDAASGILQLLAKGESGQAYNISDKASVCSIGELAHSIAAQAGTKVVFDLPTEAEQRSFLNKNHAILSPAKIEGLGWCALTHLDDGLRSTIEIIKA